MNDFGFRNTLKFMPPLDIDYRPIAMENLAYNNAKNNYGSNFNSVFGAEPSVTFIHAGFGAEFEAEFKLDFFIGQSSIIRILDNFFEYGETTFITVAQIVRD